jgi:glycine/D-amino acid oxidase-like deaminating enzyme
MLRIDELSFWEKTSYFENIDFLIIGSGIVGMSTSLYLKTKYPNAKIVIIERGYLPTGASSKNAGFTCFGSPTELFDDLNSMDEKLVWKTFSDRYHGLKCLFDLVDPKSIEYDPCKSWDLIASNSKNEINPEFIEYINEKAKGLTGIDQIYSEDKLAVKTFGFKNIETAYCNSLEGGINTGLLVKSLHQKAVDAGVQIVFGIEALSMEATDQEITLDTNQGLVKSAHCIIATNGFAKQWINEDIQPARAQVLVTNPIKDLKIKGTFHYEKGYYYFRNIGDRILLGGGRNLDFEEEETTKFGTTQKIQNALESLLTQTIIPNQDYSIDYSWSGVMGVGANKSPIIKMLNKNTAIGVRLGGMGVALGPQVGKKLSSYF